jgi:hypothetical protein
MLLMGHSFVSGCGGETAIDGDCRGNACKKRMSIGAPGKISADHVTITFLGHIPHF